MFQTIFLWMSGGFYYYPLPLPSTDGSCRRAFVVTFPLGCGGAQLAVFHSLGQEFLRSLLVRVVGTITHRTFV